MKRDWFCPCVLFFVGTIWLAVSLYFSVTAWLRLEHTKQNYVKGTCKLASVDARVCTRVRGGANEPGCQIAVRILRNVSFPGARPSPVGLPSIAVQLPKRARGCVFENCLRARRWRETQFENERTSCWVKKGGGKSPAILIVNPDGNAKRNSIMFTAFSCVAVLMMGSMIIVMCGLLCSRRS